MREAFGGTYMIGLLLTFLAIYIAVIAVALNYARAFKVKNQIINIIEQNEGIDFTDTSTGSVLDTINNDAMRFGYFVNIEESVVDNLHCYQNGYCIEELVGTSDIDGISAKYYKVTTYMRVDFPFFELNMSIPIQGETKMIQVIGG